MEVSIMESVENVIKEMRITDKNAVGSISRQETETMLIQQRKLLYAMNANTVSMVDRELANEHAQKIKLSIEKEKDGDAEKHAKVKLAKEISVVEIYSPEMTTNKRLFDYGDTVEFHYKDYAGIGHEAHLKTTVEKLVEPLLMNSLENLTDPRIDSEGFKRAFQREYMDAFKPFEFNPTVETDKKIFDSPYRKEIHAFHVYVTFKPRL